MILFWTLASGCSSQTCILATLQEVLLSVLVVNSVPQGPFSESDQPDMHFKFPGTDSARNR